MSDGNNDSRELLVGWVQQQHGRILVELIEQPAWAVDPPYIENWRRPRWTIYVRDPDPGSQSHIYGTQCFDVRDVHPMTKAARDMLRLRDDGPPSPFITPELP